MIPPDHLVRAFLKQARDNQVAVYLVYGYQSGDRAIVAAAANVDPQTSEGLRRTMLGIDDVGLLLAAQALHEYALGCDVCLNTEASTPPDKWDKLTHNDIQAHIRPVRIIIDALKARAATKASGQAPT